MLTLLSTTVMQVMGVAVLIIVGIAVWIIKITLKRQKPQNRNGDISESDRREQERAQRNLAAKKTESRTYGGGSAPRDPFPLYRVNPFDESSKYMGSLSAAQLNEWLLDFAAAEKAGAARPEKSDIKPLFARYLFESGFNYRLLRKIRGYTPQNRLNCGKTERKIKPAVPLCGISNPPPVLPLPEIKTPPDAYVRQKSITMPLPKKDFGARRQLYESFYVNKD